MVYGMQEIKLNNSERRRRWEWEMIQVRLYKISVKSLALLQYQAAGGTFINAELAAEYGIVDIDGRAITSLRAERGAPIWRPIRDAGHGR